MPLTLSSFILPARIQRKERITFTSSSLVFSFWCLSIRQNDQKCLPKSHLQEFLNLEAQATWGTIHWQTVLKIRVLTKNFPLSWFRPLNSFLWVLNRIDFISLSTYTVRLKTNKKQCSSWEGNCSVEVGTHQYCNSARTPRVLEGENKDLR